MEKENRKWKIEFSKEAIEKSKTQSQQAAGYVRSKLMTN